MDLGKLKECGFLTFEDDKIEVALPIRAVCKLHQVRSVITVRILSQKTIQVRLGAEFRVIHTVRINILTPDLRSEAIHFFTSLEQR